MGAKGFPCGIPLITSLHSEKKPFNSNFCFLKHKKDLIQFITDGLAL